MCFGQKSKDALSLVLLQHPSVLASATVRAVTVIPRVGG